MTRAKKIVIAIAGLLPFLSFNTLLGGVAEGTDVYPLVLIWSLASGIAYGIIAMLWVTE